WRHQFTAQKLWSISFHHDPRFEIEPRGESEVFVERPGITVDATVLAAAIRIDAVREANIRAVVGRNQLFGAILKEKRFRRRPFWIDPGRILLVVERNEAVRGIVATPAPADRLRHTATLNRTTTLPLGICVHIITSTMDFKWVESSSQWAGPFWSSA